jgi:hypothetical protein
VWLKFGKLLVRGPELLRSQGLRRFNRADLLEYTTLAYGKITEIQHTVFNSFPIQAPFLE